MCSCTGNRIGGRGGQRNTKPQDKDFQGQDHWGGRCLLPSRRPPSPPPPLKYYQHHSQRARPQAPGSSIGKSWGRPARHWMDPVGGGRPVKVHCRRRGGQPRHRAEPEGRRGKGESTSAQTRTVGGVGAL